MDNNHFPEPLVHLKYPLLTGLGGISFVVAPLAAGWCVLGLWSGRRHLVIAAAGAKQHTASRDA